MPIKIQCPFFKYEKEGVICEAGKIEKDLRDFYTNEYCASITGFKKCTLYRSKELAYETVEERSRA